MTGTSPDASRAGPLTATDFVMVAWRRKWLLLVCSLLSIGAGAIYISRAEPEYEAEARLLVQKKDVLGDPAHALARRDDEFLMTQAQIISSPVVVDSAVSSSAANDSAELPQASDILNNLKASPVPGTNVIKISYSGQNEDEAIQTIQAVVASYRGYVHEMQKDSYRETLKLLTKSEKQLRDEIVELENEYLVVCEAGSLIGHGRDASSVQRSLLSGLGATINDVRNRRIELTNQLNRMLEAGTPLVAAPAPTEVLVVSDSVSPLSDSPERIGVFLAQAEQVLQQQGDNEIDDIRSDLREVKAADIKLSQKFESVHPDRVALQEQIDELDQALTDRLNKAPSILRNELEAVREQETELTGLYETELEKAKQAEVHAVGQQQALDRVERVQGGHDTILAQLRQFELADNALGEGNSGVRVSLLQEPVLVQAGISPPPKLLLIACGLFGIVGGFALATMLERRRMSLGRVAAMAHEPSTSAVS